jgi:hypothetical protein
MFGCDPVEGAAINRVEMSPHVLVVLDAATLGLKVLGARFLKKYKTFMITYDLN